MFLSARDGNADLRAMGRRYDRWMSALQDDLIASWPDIVVADCEGVVLGYAIGVPTDAGYVVAYVYVKRAYRKLGIARELVAALADRAGDAPLLSGLHIDRFAEVAKRYTSGHGDLEAALDARRAS